MAWVKLDDNFPEHRKIIDLTLAAEGLWVNCLAYANRRKTDGFLSMGAIVRESRGEDYGPLVAQLLAAELWVEVDGGFEIVNYGKYQPTTDRIEETRAARSESGRVGANARWQSDSKTIANEWQNDSNDDGKSLANDMAKKCPRNPYPVTRNQDPETEKGVSVGLLPPAHAKDTPTDVPEPDITTTEPTQLPVKARPNPVNPRQSAPIARPNLPDSGDFAADAREMQWRSECADAFAEGMGCSPPVEIDGLKVTGDWSTHRNAMFYQLADASLPRDLTAAEVKGITAWLIDERKHRKGGRSGLSIPLRAKEIAEKRAAWRLDGSPTPDEVAARRAEHGPLKPEFLIPLNFSRYAMRLPPDLRDECERVIAQRQAGWEQRESAKRWSEKLTERLARWAATQQQIRA